MGHVIFNCISKVTKEQYKIAVMRPMKYKKPKNLEIVEKVDFICTMYCTYELKNLIVHLLMAYGIHINLVFYNDYSMVIGYIQYA